MALFVKGEKKLGEGVCCLTDIQVGAFMLFTEHLTTLCNKMGIYFTILKGPRI